MDATEVRYWYFSIDADHDVSAATLELSVDDGLTYKAAEPVSAPPHAASLDAPPAGLTRYWWRILTGPGQQLVLTSGRSTIRGRLADNPELLHPTWVLTT